MKIDAKICQSTITSHNALGKVIYDMKAIPPAEDVFENLRWKYHIDDLADPNAWRKVQRTQNLKTKMLVWDPSANDGKGAAVQKPQKPVEELEKRNYSHTLKTAVSLLPPTGMVSLYTEAAEIVVGLIYDIQKCQIKDKYIFSAHARTSGKWWRTPDDESPPMFFELSASSQLAMSAQENKMYRATVDMLKQLSKHGVGGYNELLVGVSKESLVGVFYSLKGKENQLLSRLTARARQRLVYKQLAIELPIFAIGQGIKEYTDQEIKQDLEELAAEKSEEAKGALEILSKRAGKPKNLENLINAQLW